MYFVKVRSSKKGILIVERGSGTLLEANNVDVLIMPFVRGDLQRLYGLKWLFERTKERTTEQCAQPYMSGKSQTIGDFTVSRPSQTFPTNENWKS